MYTVKSNAEFLADIRALDEKLKNIRLTSIEIDRKQSKISYNFICDTAVEETLQKKILMSFIPRHFLLLIPNLPNA